MIRDLVIENRSYRSFNEAQPVKADDLRDLIDTARLVSSAVNKQPIKYKICDSKTEVEKLLSLTKWAGLLKDTKLPPDGHHPTAFIIMCHDTSISEESKFSAVDVGIAAQTIMLSACEMGIGGCMIGAFNPDEVSDALRIPTKYHPVLILALGIPDETVLITELPEGGNTDYFRDKAGLHFVPKRPLNSVIID